MASVRARSRSGKYCASKTHPRSARRHPELVRRDRARLQSCRVPPSRSLQPALRHAGRLARKCVAIQVSRGQPRRGGASFTPCIAWTAPESASRPYRRKRLVALRRARRQTLRRRAQRAGFFPVHPDPSGERGIARSLAGRDTGSLCTIRLARAERPRARPRLVHEARSVTTCETAKESSRHIVALSSRSRSVDTCRESTSPGGRSGREPRRGANEQGRSRCQDTHC